MGISGLLPLLKSIHKHCKLSKFAGQTIGIDAYGWLHRGTVACAVELATGKPTTKYVDFAMSRVRMLMDFGVTPYLVFDGDAIPSKGATNADRRRKREESLKTGLELLHADKLSLAHQELQKAAGVTPYMARQLIEELKRQNVQYIVAPYEADAQLAYLEQKGIIDGVLSEDSDLLVFGVKRLITKLDQYGECVEIERANFASCREISLAGWTDTMFRRMAILSGCDYLPNIPKMGLKTAYRYVRKYKDTERAIRTIQFDGFLVPAGYLESFKHAELTFLHHRVFCPIAQKVVFLNELEPGTREEDMPFLGPDVEPDTAIAVACGDLDPKTREPIQLRASTTASSRPPLRETRRTTIASAADLKPKKSIESFFKAHRQPLAELDPNSLTPSPSQQRLLQVHANASWESRMASSAPQIRRPNNSLGGPAESSHGADRRTFLARAAAVSTYQPPKRQRLCSESEDFSPSKEIKQSPFFTTNAQLEAPSPLAQKKPRPRKARKSNFEVWSDDSLPDEVFLSLPDVHEIASPEKHVTYPNLPVEETGMVRAAATEDNTTESIPQSPPTKATESPPKIQVSRETSLVSTVITNPSQQDISQTTDATSIAISPTDDTQAFESLMEYHIRQQNRALRKTFVCQSPPERKAALDSVGSQKSPTPRPPQMTFLAVSPEKQTAALASLLPSTAELDRLEDLPKTNLLQKSAHKDSTEQITEARSLSPSQPQPLEAKIELAKSALFNTQSSQTAPQAKQGPRSSLQRLSERASGWKMPAVSVRGGEALNEAELEACNPVVEEDFYPEERPGLRAKASGSEDLMVPSSDDDREEYVDAPEMPKFNLKAFAFTGR